ncbi:hypothetical protein [Marivirga sp.]|uniref:hypothetical protein n=1 Tax=Marivirga sp. TaxID=2018662 RepID=UPI002D7E41DF|nr:hypothetical protein [Marivirga sp.]HET8859295.1 hypothetical protein [Marivirga sp.]
MKNYHSIILSGFLIAFTACSGTETAEEKKNYSLSIKEAEEKHKVFTNRFQTNYEKNYLDIEAENIPLKEIVGLFYQVDTSQVRFENPSLNKFYQLEFKQMDSSKSTLNNAINQISQTLDITIDSIKKTSYLITVMDTVKLNDYINKSGDDYSTKMFNDEGIKLENHKISGLTEILRNQYSTITKYEGEPLRIDYEWEKESFEELKEKLENELGLNFEPAGEVNYYTIKEN